MISAFRSSRYASSRANCRFSARDWTPARGSGAVDHLIEHRIEVHYRPSTWASAASASRQPEGHAHGAVQVDGARLGAGAGLADRPVRLGAEAEVAVGLEWAHPQLLGQGEGLAVVLHSALIAPGSSRATISPRRLGHTPGTVSTCALGQRQRAPSAKGAPPPGGRPAAAPPPGRGRSRGALTVGLATVALCSIARVSSGAASAMRSARIYAATWQGPRPPGEKDPK